MLAGVAYVLAVAATGFAATPRKADVAIVLGNEVMANGEPSARLRARLESAFEVYEAGLTTHVIVSGGTGLSGHNEAVVMKDYLVERGIPEVQVLTDPNGVDTRATAINAFAMMQQRGWRDALVVSQFFHLPRTMMAMRAAGASTVSGAYPHYHEWRDLYSLAREAVAIPYYLLRDTVSPGSSAPSVPST